MSLPRMAGDKLYRMISIVPELSIAVGEYTIDNLESADRIAYRSSIPPNKYIDIIRVEEPVQTRSGSRFSQALPPATN
jgi:hypothetical protein